MANGPLSPRDRDVLEALLPGLLATGFEDFYVSFRRDAAAPMRLGASAALWAGSWVAPVLIGRLPPLSRLSAADREAALEALGRSRFYALRQLLLVLKAVVSFHYGALPEPRRSVGYPW